MFTDLGGDPLDVDANPSSESCAPCHLDALLSDDGTEFAVAHWPTAFWDTPIPDGDEPAARDACWEGAVQTPVEFSVIDLDDGTERWHTRLEPPVRLLDFDGRYLVVGEPIWSQPQDTVVVFDNWSDASPARTGDGITLVHSATTPSG